jgi:hypothetical protein
MFVPNEVATRTILVADVIDIVEQLAEFYETPEIIQWLQSPHPQLENQTAESLIADGRAYDVHRVIQRLKADGYI